MDRTEAESQAVQALRKGRPEGLRELIRIYELPALRLAFSIIGDRQLAEDAVAEAFVRLWRAAKRYNPDRPFGPWFYRIVTNRAVSAAGGRARWSLSGLLPPLLRDAADPEPGPEELAIRKDEQSFISAALRVLPPQQRAAVFLRYYLDMSEPQIADVLGKPLGSVKSGLHLARTRLKQELRPEADANGARQAEGGTS